MDRYHYTKFGVSSLTGFQENGFTDDGQTDDGMMTVALLCSNTKQR